MTCIHWLRWISIILCRYIVYTSRNHTMNEHGSIEHEKSALDSASEVSSGGTCTLTCTISGTRETQVQQKKHEREVKYIKSHVLSWLWIIIDYRASKWCNCNSLSNWLQKNCHRQLECVLYFVPVILSGHSRHVGCSLNWNCNLRHSPVYRTYCYYRTIPP